MFFFEMDWKSAMPLALLVPFLIFFIKLSKKFQPPQLAVADLSSFLSTERSLKEKWASLPHWLMVAGLVLFLLALVDPQVYKQRDNASKRTPSDLSVEGIALYLVLDQSGSMKEQVDVASIDSGGGRIVTKIDLLKEVTRLFIQGDPKLSLSGRGSDLIGLVEFARAARVVVPLTLDHRAVLEKLSQFEAVKQPDQDGTAIGYAIFKTANLIVTTRQYARDLIGQGKPAYEIKSGVILLVTDGLQDPNPLDNGKRWRQVSPLEAAQYAKDNHIRLYIVNVEPSLATAQFEANLNQMKKAAELTGGQFYMLDKGKSLIKIYSAINALEQSSIPLSDQIKADLEKNLSKAELPNFFKAYPLYPYLIFSGMCCLLLSILLSTTLLKRFP